MARIIQHVPSFITDGRIRKRSNFKTQKQLLNIHFVKDFSRIDNFSGFAIDHDDADGYILVATYADGKTWMAVGYLNDISMLNLPAWIAGNAAPQKEIT